MGFRKVQFKKETLPNAPKKKEDVIKAVEEYLKNSSDALGGLTFDQIQLHYSSEIPASDHQPGLVFVQFVQVREGMVVEGSDIHMTVKVLKDRSSVVSVKTRVFPNIQLPAAAVKKNQDLKRFAKEKHEDKQDEILGDRQAIRYINGQWRRIYEIVFSKEPRYQYVIDTTTGEFLGLEDRAHDGFPSIQGKTTGRGVLFNPSTTGDNLDVLPLKYLKITAIPETITYTDSVGNFRFDSIFQATDISATLEGLRAKVYSCNNAQSLDDCFNNPINLTEHVVASPGALLSLNFNPVGNNEFATSQINAYYHINYIHDWLKERLPTDFNRIDNPILAFVNNNIPRFECNGFYLGSPPEEPNLPGWMMLGSAQINYVVTHPSGIQITYDSCQNAAFDTFIYHEYGHYLDDMAGGITFVDAESLELIEGLADIIAAYASGGPIFAEGMTQPPLISPNDPLGYARTAENDCQYSSDMTWNNLHLNNGCYWRLVVSGFTWHLRENLMAGWGEEEGRHIAEQLILQFMLSNSVVDIPTMVHDIAILDDDDDDLTNGTPHILPIIRAAQYHGIPVPDYLPPTGSITINNGAAFSNSTAVTLNLMARDEQGAVLRMRISNINPTDWFSIPEENYVTTKSWMLTAGDGVKIVYARFKDSAGNWSAVSSDTIVLNTSQPDLTITQFFVEPPA